MKKLLSVYAKINVKDLKTQLIVIGMFLNEIKRLSLLVVFIHVKPLTCHHFLTCQTH